MRSRFEHEELLAFYEFNEDPFRLKPSLRYFYLSGDHKRNINEITDNISRQDGFSCLIGPYGAGKSSAASYICDLFTDDQGSSGEGILRKALYVPTASTLTPRSFLLEMAQGLGLEETRHSVHEYIGLFYDFLLREVLEKGRIFVVAVDEAQKLRARSLDFLRDLLNLEAEKRNLVQVLLVGSPDFIPRLRKREYLATRLTRVAYLAPLGEEEIQNLIKFRLRIAGRSRALFTPKAFKTIFKYSRGIPRQAVLLSHEGVSEAFKKRKEKVDAEDILSRLSHITLDFWGE